MLLGFHRSWCKWELYRNLTEKENEELVECMIQVTNKYLDRISGSNQKSLKQLTTVQSIIHNWITFTASTLFHCSKKYVIKNVEKWFPVLHKKTRQAYMEAREKMKASVNYRKATGAESNKEEKENSDNQNNGDDNNNIDQDIFTDEDIEKILKLNSDIEGEMGQWIIDELIKTTDQCFEFGIYLSKFVVFDQKGKEHENTNKYQVPFPQLYIDFMKQYCGINWALM